MAYLALYRKYRPTNFEEVAGQKEIIKVLKNSIENNKVSHAYLFSARHYGTCLTYLIEIADSI